MHAHERHGIGSQRQGIEYSQNQGPTRNAALKEFMRLVYIEKAFYRKKGKVRGQVAAERAPPWQRDVWS